MYQKFTDFVKTHHHISVIQAENPDGDSLGSALALDYILRDNETTLYCPVDIPKYLRYFFDWSRVSGDFDFNADAYIIVDTASQVLLGKLLDTPAIKEKLYSSPVFVLDHHETADDLDFPHDSIIEPRPACCDLIYQIAKDQKFTIDQHAAEYLYYGILSDTLGLTTEGVTSETFRTVAELLDLGVNVFQLEEQRRELNKKSQKILDYKADLIKRIEYHLDGRLATVHIPWEDIEEYSDEYNPGVLIIDEIRQVEGVEVAVAIKTYPDGKVTGKLRSSTPVSEQLAGYFGGGGHPYAAGFRTYDTDYETVVKELIAACVKIMPEKTSEQEEQGRVWSF